MLHALLLSMTAALPLALQDLDAPAAATAVPGGIQAGTSGTGLAIPCTKAVDDFSAPGNCIPASSVPALGMLFPISAELFVDADTGYVGLGTTDPASPFSLFRAGASHQVGITQAQVGGGSTMELTTRDSSGDQASRIVLSGGSDQTDIAMYRGGRGSESRTFRIRGADGNVEIGQPTSTIRKLNLKGSMNIEDNGAARVLIDPNRLGTGEVAQLFLDTNGGIVATLQNYADNDNFIIGIVDLGSFVAGMYENLNGDGILFADIKNFRVPNPADPTTDIVYASLEGPEAAMYIRGTARLLSGRATVELPEHFSALADTEGISVQLTPMSLASEGLAVVSVTPELLEVGELRSGAGSYEFSWEVTAVRRAHRDYEVIRPWTETRADHEASETEAWQHRLRRVEQRAERMR
jgi:hypothetical protein